MHFRFMVVASLLGILTLNEAIAQSGWVLQNPLTTRSQLNSVHFVDAQTGWVVGEDGIILKTTDGGSSWQPQNSTITNNLEAVHFVDAQTGWAVGTSFSSAEPQAPILKTSDGGASWTLQSSQEAHRLWSVHFVDVQTGWAVGVDRELKGIIIKTTDGGAMWTPQDGGTTELLTSVHFVDAQTGWVVGRVGTILNTTDGGTTWLPQNSLVGNWLKSVYFHDAQTGWAVGSSGILLKTANGGTTWESQTWGPRDNLEAVHFVDDQNGWAVGQVFGQLGAILHTTDGGTTWMRQTSGNSSLVLSLLAVQFLDASTGWAVGERGLVLKTTDGGATWTNFSSATLAHLNTIFFLDANTGWAGGEGASLLKTTSDGVGWSAVSTPRLLIHINDIYFADAKTGWTCQLFGRMFKTTDGGDSWVQVTTPGSCQGLFFIDAQTGWAVGGGAGSARIFKTVDGGDSWTEQLDSSDLQALIDVFFIDASTGWAVGLAGTILKTTDGGDTWLPQNSGDTDWLESVYFHDADVGFIAGSGGLLETSNGGTTWTPKDVGDGWLDDLFFIDPLNGWAVGAIASQLSKSIDGAGDIDISGGTAKTWRTTDGGNTWTEEVLPIRAWLLSAFFTDLNSGWAVSTWGTIVKFTDNLALPTPPSNLSARVLSETEITLTWTDNATNEDGFRLYRSDGVSGAFRLLTSLDANTTQYTDPDLSNGTTYWYRLSAFNVVGRSAISLDAFATAGSTATGVSVEQLDEAIPTEFHLDQNFPNPFNPTTTIRFALPVASQVRLSIYNLAGVEVATLVHASLGPGVHTAVWNASQIASGVYVYMLRTQDFVDTKKLILIK